MFLIQKGSVIYSISECANILKDESTNMMGFLSSFELIFII